MPEDIIELLENLRVEPHQQVIIDIAVNEIATLRQLKQEWREAILDLEGHILPADWMFVSHKTQAAYAKAVESE